MTTTFTKNAKQILAGLFLVCLCLCANASYVEKFPITVTQPDDGTVVSCFATGDEYYHWVHDENGFTLIRDPQTGIVVYATLENDELVSTGYRAGSVDPAATGLQPWTIISPEKRMQIREDFLKKTPPKPVNPGYQPPRGGWNNGTIQNLVIYIRFSDETEFPPEKAAIYNDMHNKEEEGYPSMYSYFKAVSNEKTFIPTTFYPVTSGDLIISYQDIYPRSYFQPYSTYNPDGYQGGDNGDERTEREHQLLARAVEAVKHEIPTDLDLDFNNDGFVDNICFIVRGAPGDWAVLLWPHRWALYSEYVTINGKQVWDFNMQIETHLDGSSASVLSHEMSHTLSSPDLYRYQYNGTPVGQWDLMASNTSPPQSMTAWMKYQYGGWIDNIPTITETGTYTLNNVWSETNYAYRIASPNSSTEFFVVEYRDKNVYWDSNLPGSGLLIYRINTKENGNAQGPPDELYIYRKGGTSNMADDGDIKNAFFSEQSGRTAFNNSSDPPCFLSNNQPGSIYISNISASGGETMSFYVDFSMANTEIHVTPNELTFANIPVGTTSEPQTITVSGTDLTHPILYEKSGTNHELFTIEETDWNPETGGTLSVTFMSEAAKIYTSKIVFSSLGAVSKTVTLKAQGTTVAIGEQDAADGIAIYPNPTTGLLTICDMRYAICDVAIFDVLGRIVGATLAVASDGTHQSQIEMDISYLPTGIYFVKIQTENNVATKKVIKK
ncbi:MAG: M6 family metalloprotease domain-containing protein [Bacteroidales bacterium]|nr:M6 family metalloprotease domain-containing protein [Bacteroidales bacterium]